MGKETKTTDVSDLLTHIDDEVRHSFFQLSVSHNQLVRMFQVGKLHHLKVLDLSHNKIVSIEGLKVISGNKTLTAAFYNV